MTPDDLEELLERTRPALADAALRERALSAARARWHEPVFGWHWRLLAAAAALIALDILITARVSSQGPASSAAPPSPRIAVDARPHDGTPTLLLVQRSGLVEKDLP